DRSDAPDDEHVGARTAFEARDCQLVAERNVVAQAREMGRFEPRWQGQQGGASERNPDEIRKEPSPLAADWHPEHGAWMVVDAGVHQSPRAPVTTATGEMPAHDDELAGVETQRALSHLHHFGYAFVAEVEGPLERGLPTDDQDVQVAGRRRDGTHDHISRIADRRARHLVPLEPIRADVAQGLAHVPSAIWLRMSCAASAGTVAIRQDASLAKRASCPSRSSQALVRVD